MPVPLGTALLRASIATAMATVTEGFAQSNTASTVRAECARHTTSQCKQQYRGAAAPQLAGAGARACTAMDCLPQLFILRNEQPGCGQVAWFDNNRMLYRGCAFLCPPFSWLFCRPPARPLPGARI